MTTYIPPKKNAEFIFYTSLVSQSTGQWQANPTLAAGDVKVATDDGAPANIGTLPAVDADFTKRIKVTLSAAEMNGDNVTVIFSDAAGAEWDDMTVGIQTSVRQIDDLAFPTTSGRSMDVTATGEVGIDWANIGGATTTQNLSGTTVKTATDVETDTADIQSRLPAALSGDGFIKADLLSIGDELVSGNNATLKLKMLDIQNSTDNAVRLSSTAAAGHGLFVTSLDSSAANIVSTNSNAVQITAAASGMVIDAGFYGINLQGGDGSSGMLIEGGIGLEIYGDTDAGAYLYGYGVNSPGIEISGQTGGKSINAPQDIAVSDGNLTLAAIASAVWAAGTRTLTSFGTLAADVWTSATRTLTAISDSAGVTTLLSRIGGALNISGGKVESNVKQINDTNVTGDGSTTPWGPA